MNRPCIQCGKVFHHGNLQKKTCSEWCRKTRKNQMDKMYRNRHKEANYIPVLLPHRPSIWDLNPSMNNEAILLAEEMRE